jgi:very-short-patch-repair endonuclease
MTYPERLLWARLRARRCGGHKFRRQVSIGRYVVDFMCEQAKLVVELDGMSHLGRVKEDALRTEQLQELGLRVSRVTNDDVLQDADAVAEYIRRCVEQRLEQLAAGPHPNPLPRGEGADPIRTG